MENLDKILDASPGDLKQSELIQEELDNVCKKADFIADNMLLAYKDAATALDNFIKDKKNSSLTAMLAVKMSECFQAGNKIMICGNGGSACDAMHFAEEFTGRYRKDRQALPVMHLADPSHVTCVANDFGFSEVFSRNVDAFGKPGDWLICLSTSGNSENIIKAYNAAKTKKINTLGLLGKDGGKLKGKCDFEFIIPAKTADRIQEIHMIILHVLIEGIERNLFPEHYK